MASRFPIMRASLASARVSLYVEQSSVGAVVQEHAGYCACHAEHCPRHQFEQQLLHMYDSHASASNWRWSSSVHTSAWSSIVKFCFSAVALAFSSSSLAAAGEM